nr:hypothetical protein [uncultured Methylophaga sp.]
MTKRLHIFACLIFLVSQANVTQAAPIAITDGTSLLGINNVEVGSFGTFNIIFSTAFNDKLETNEFSHAASYSLASLFMTDGFLQGTSFDYMPNTVFGCTSSIFPCRMITPSTVSWSSGGLFVNGWAFVNYATVGEGAFSSNQSDSDDAVRGAGAVVNPDGSIKFPNAHATFVEWSPVVPSAVPVPSAALMFMPAVLGFAFLRRKKSA